jgi:hypothetical protein
MSVPLAAVGPSAYWYLARGTGGVSLLLLTASVVLGVMGPLRFAAAPRWPRFTIDMFHREVSLLVVVLLAVHIITSVLDSFAPVKLTDAVIPFVSSYRPLWLGLGALSFDILVALTATSLARRHIGYRRWRTIHWLAYACWPIAVLHGLGTGSDTKVLWMLALTAVCVAAVAVAVVIRIARSKSRSYGRRGVAIALTVATPIAIAVFTLAGPLQHGWARKAGTPASLLSKSFVPTSAVAPVAQPSRKTAAALKVPFSARITGNLTESQAPGGAIIDLSLRLSGGARGELRIRLAGAPMAGGGLSLTGSQVDLVANGLPSVMEGRIVSLRGQEFVAHVVGSAPAMDLHGSLSIDQGTRSVTGTLSATSGGRH